jgi:transposase-like protein
MDVDYCPSCGSDDTIRYVGKLESGEKVYYCSNCDIYFAVKELELPFKVTIDEEE